MSKTIFLFLSLFAVNSIIAQDAITYQVPPKDIMDLALAKPSPGISIDTKGEWMLLQERSDMPTVEDLAQPELRIAGLRINPYNFGPSRASYIIGLKLKNSATKQEYSITGLPNNLKVSDIQWNMDDSKIGFLHTTTTTIDLYVIDVKTKKATKLNKQPVNAVLANSYTWYNASTIYYSAAAKPVSQAPPKPIAPKGPVVQQNLGKVAASVTYQDLIKNPYDEQLFAFYATTQLIKNTNGVETKIGTPTLYANYSFSPDAKYMLVERIEKPFSYLVTANGFNSTVYITDANGKELQTITKLPSSELAPSGYDNVLNAPRGHSWVNSLPNTLMWMQPLDSGLIKKKVDFHDAVYFQNIGGDNTPKEIAKSKMRMGGLTAVTENLFLLNEYSRVKQLTKTSKFDLAKNELITLFERSTNDAYNDPGQPITAKNNFGKYVPKLMNGSTFLMRGVGASPKGDLPFLRSFDMNTKETKELWRCQEPYYESVVAFLDYDNMQFITSKQSQNEPPNYFLYENNKATQLTNFADPQPSLRGITKQKITYKRPDGVDLAADLYLPKGYNKEKDGPLPVIMWAYPREFKSSSDAAQIRGSKYTFVRVGYGSIMFWATQGYAIMDNAEFPIVGEGDKAPNDNFIEQLVANAKAGIDKVAEMGVGDSTRVAVGGHSYGAFMTANLLAHCKLFKAGIARSGAYNRTLTPFGFQNEERTYWQAPELYFKMSPFSYANQIKTPMLMIHGEADNNPGTFPIQSERLYNAIKGHGGTVRFVQLPFESHGYAAKENILHMLWEQHQWLEKYVKGAKGK
jgi:dipeptidyl aminopeptidase/acylaminoacyl peptidase